MSALLEAERIKVCAVCGIPVDAQYFDESRIVDLQQEEDLMAGRTAVIARFELPAQYCGILQHFFQFTDTHAGNPSRADTPDFQWTIRVNGHPLYPYIALKHIVNPWGCPSCPVAIRLDENALLEFVVRRVSSTDPDTKKIGARVVGRYWYNTDYGNGP